MATIAQLFDLADPRVRHIWDEKQTQLSTRLEYGMLGLTDWTADILNSEFQNFTGLGIAQQTGEQEPYHRQDIQEGKQVTITPIKFTTAISISEEMLRFNLWPQINNLVGGVANSLNARIDTDAAKIFYLGFGTTFFTGGDGLSLYNSAHTMADGSTQSNTLGTVSLSYDNLKTALQTMDLFYDDKGIRLLPCTKLRLLVGRRNKERAEEVLRSIGNPDSANRVSNVFANGLGYIDYKVSNWFPDAYQYYWFVVDLERASFMAFMVWGWRPRFDDDKVINNGTKVYTGSVMERPGFQSFQWTVGSAATS
jgi:hypothetical protein